MSEDIGYIYILVMDDRKIALLRLTKKLMNKLSERKNKST